MSEIHIWQQVSKIGGIKYVGIGETNNRQIGLKIILSKYGEKQLEENIWFGCEHSDCLNQAKMILKKLEEQKPQLIILEGMTFWNKSSLEQKLDYLKQFENLSLENCLKIVREKGAVYFYLVQNLEKVKNGEIEIVCGEGSLEMELQKLTQEYDKHDILEMYLIREICQYFRKLQNETEFNLEKLLEFVAKFVRITRILELLELKNFALGDNLRNFLLNYLANLEQKYQKCNLNLQTFDKTTLRKLEYLMIPHENSQIKIRRIKKTLSNLRDYFLMQKLEQCKEKSSKAFILYGSGHIKNIQRLTKNKIQELKISKIK